MHILLILHTFRPHLDNILISVLVKIEVKFIHKNKKIKQNLFMFKLEFKIGDTVVNKTADNENEVRRLVYLFMTGSTVELEAHVKSVLNTQTTATTTEDKPKQKSKEQNIINNEKID